MTGASTSPGLLEIGAEPTLGLISPGLLETLAPEARPGKPVPWPTLGSINPGPLGTAVVLIQGSISPGPLEMLAVIPA